MIDQSHNNTFGIMNVFFYFYIIQGTSNFLTYIPNNMQAITGKRIDCFEWYNHFIIESGATIDD